MEIAGQDAELPEIRLRARILAGTVLVAVAGLAIRLFYLQIIEGDRYYKITSDSIVRTTNLPAIRGEIRDHKGRVLATTRPSYSVVVTPSQVTAENYRRVTAALSADYEDLPTWERIQELARKERDKSITIAEDIPRERMAAIGTAMDSAGVVIRAESRRHYPMEGLFAHSLGYMNEISAEELRTRKDDGYRAGDLIGRTGVERQWESYLRGQKGFEKAVVDRRNLPRAGIRVADLVEGPIRQDPVPGNNVILTLDTDMQRIVDRSLRGKAAAAVVVLEVATGRVLSLVSKPGFNPNVMSGRLSPEEEARIARDPLRPFRDKTLSDTYNPGSTFKVVSTIAALEEKVITPEDRTRCVGHLEVGRRRFKCEKSHLSISLHPALVQSCNVFFYEIGARPGMMNRLAKYATELGLGASSGLGLNGESPGFVPTEEWHREQQVLNPKSEGFVIGNALNTAIGEGATRATVMQMALLYAALANGGRLWLPQMVERVETPAGQVIEEFPPRARRDVSVSPETLAILRKALTGVMNDPKGTAWKARSQRIEIAGKTGTAQVQGGGRRRNGDPPLPYERLPHAWFVGFAPANEPKIALAVLVEHGGHGGDVAAPVAVEIVESYFGLQATADAGEPKASGRPGPRRPVLR
jgi:penicillin-binding protein 2